MKQVLFVQGGGKNAHDDWDDKLVASLQQYLGSAYAIAYPRMPDEEAPNAHRWQTTIAAELAKLGEGAIFVAHSVGAAIALDYLAAAPPARRLAGIFLLAIPFIGEGGWPSDELHPIEQLATALSDLAGEIPLHLYFGGDDETVPPQHGHLFEKTVPRARVSFLPGRDHQLKNDLSSVARDIQRLAR